VGPKRTLIATLLGLGLFGEHGIGAGRQRPLVSNLDRLAICRLFAHFFVLVFAVFSGSHIIFCFRQQSSVRQFLLVRLSVGRFIENILW
jgi:hypothetical protein